MEEQKIIRNGLERENEQILNTKSNFYQNYGRFQVVYFIIYRCMKKGFSICKIAMLVSFL